MYTGGKHKPQSAVHLMDSFACQDFHSNSTAHTVYTDNGGRVES